MNLLTRAGLTTLNITRWCGVAIMVYTVIYGTGPAYLFDLLAVNEGVGALRQHSGTTALRVPIMKTARYIWIHGPSCMEHHTLRNT